MVFMLCSDNKSSSSVCTITVACVYVWSVITYSKSMDQPGKVANPARGQLNKEKSSFPVPVCA